MENNDYEWDDNASELDNKAYRLYILYNHNKNNHRKHMDTQKEFITSHKMDNSNYCHFYNKAIIILRNDKITK